MIIVLMGVTGVGKSTVGLMLADALGWRFLDADDFHPPVNVAKMARGEPLTDEDRGPWLDTLADVLHRLGAAGQSAVLACSALRASYRARLADHTPDVRFVWLRGDPRLIARRLGERTGHFMDPTLLDSQLATLEPPPADVLALNVDEPPAAIVREIRAAFGV